MAKNAFHLVHKQTKMVIVFEGVEYSTTAKSAGNAIASLAFKLSRRVSDLRTAEIVYKVAA
jgi:hypothetical protein